MWCRGGKLTSIPQTRDISAVSRDIKCKKTGVTWPLPWLRKGVLTPLVWWNLSKIQFVVLCCTAGKVFSISWLLRRPGSCCRLRLGGLFILSKLSLCYTNTVISPAQCTVSDIHLTLTTTHHRHLTHWFAGGPIILTSRCIVYNKIVTSFPVYNI